MFSRPHALHTPQSRPHGNLYQQVGIESRLALASPHTLVAMLFDGFMEAVALARAALRERRLEVKGAAIGRAVRIVEDGLRGGLDLRAGGTLARDLDDLYAYLVLRLTQANLRNDDDALDECRGLVLPLQQAWASIAPQADAAAAARGER
ncbi:MAG TPA: flagellar export chaperone FliS [Rubrivivax sp.]|nr:flagellar export chaperone FliS [Rubrivivax sp.]